MATLTQMENFEAELKGLDANCALLDMGYYIRLAGIRRPEVKMVRIALSTMLRKIANTHGLHFDGYEDGYPVFVNDKED